MRYNTDLMGGHDMVKRVIPTVTSSPFSEGEIERWRGEFPQLSSVVHLANCSQGAQSQRVMESLRRYTGSWFERGADWDLWVEEVDKAKAVFAKLVNCSPEDVGVVGSVSEAVSTIAGAIDYATPRNKVILSGAEFPTVGHVWLAHRKYGAKVDFVPVTDGEIPLEEYERMADDTLAMAAVTHVSYLTGYKQDLKAITDIIHAKGGMVFVDAYQGLGTCPLDVQQLGVDVLTSGNLKYLLGIPGIAFVYVRPEVVGRLRPAETGWFGQENPFAFDLRTLDYARTARRIEGGTPPVAAAFAARAGMELILDVGVDRIGQHIDYLSAYALEGAIDRGLSIMSPLDVKKKGATTSILIEGDSHQAETALRQKGIVTASRGQALRLAPHFFTKKEELDLALDELRLLS